MSNRETWPTILPALLLVLFLARLGHGDEIQARVLWLYDGDSMQVLTDQGKDEVRLYGVDCPEKGQAWSQAALKFSIREAKKQEVVLDVLGRDKYGRLLAWVRLPDGRTLNEELVRRGLAWHFERFAPDEKELARLQREARRAGRGLWADPDPVPPWEYRHR